ncbi:hypothetical protein ACF0H5_009688 [Mactra antiquata]
MVDWLHCNTCFEQPGDGRAFFLTNCGHIYCEACQNKGWQSKCLLCDSKNPTCVKLTSSMTPPYDKYLKDPIKLIKQVEIMIKDAIMATGFQAQHRSRYVSWLKKQIANQEQINQQRKEMILIKIKQRYEELKSENERLNEELSQLTMKEKSHAMRFSGSHSSEYKGQYISLDERRTNCNYNNSHNESKSYSTYLGYPRSGVLKTMGRISMRTPPSGGRLGVIPYTPSPVVESMTVRRHTPKSIPHPIYIE